MRLRTAKKTYQARRGKKIGEIKLRRAPTEVVHIFRKYIFPRQVPLIREPLKILFVGTYLPTKVFQLADAEKSTVKRKTDD